MNVIYSYGSGSKMFNRVKYWLRKRDYKNRFESMCSKDNKIVVFGTPLHRNLGDQLIAVSTKKFLSNFFDEKIIYEVPEEFYRIYSNKLDECITDNDIIVISGGGFIGNVWLGWLWLESIIAKFKNNKVIIFPQSIYFDSKKDNYTESLQRCKNIINEHPDIVLFVREKYSFQFAKKYLGEVDVRLVPDIALSYCYDNANKHISRRGICFCLRSDCEINRDVEKVKIIKNYCNDISGNIIQSETISKSRVYEFCREVFVIDKIKEYSNYQLIVTDRLHGMIFSYLAGTPCIVFDNKSRKVYGVYEEWLYKSKLIIPFRSIDDTNIIKQHINNAISGTIKDSFTINQDLFNEIKAAINNKK